MWPARRCQPSPRTGRRRARPGEPGDAKTVGAKTAYPKTAGSSRCRRQDAADGNRCADRFDPDICTGVRRVDHLAVADVDADVAGRCGRPVATGEEDEIARLGVSQARYRGADGGLLLARAGQVDAELPVDVLDEPGAVEAGRGGAAPHVRRADEPLGFADDRIAGRRAGQPGRRTQPGRPTANGGRGAVRRSRRCGRCGRCGRCDGRERCDRASGVAAPVVPDAVAADGPAVSTESTRASTDAKSPVGATSSIWAGTLAIWDWTCVIHPWIAERVSVMPIPRAGRSRDRRPR